MSDQEESQQIRPRFGAFILETLTMGMYGESRNAIREYVQNSFDSLRDAVQASLITPEQMNVSVVLDVANSEMTIRDNGLGLRSSSAVDVLVAVGSSKKDFRRNAGFRGIGRLAGIVICDELKFTTKARGDSKTTTVTFNAKKLRELLEPESQRDDAESTLAKCIKAVTSEVDEIGDHFFEVKLSKFHQPPKECLDLEALKTFLSQVSPLPYAPDFSHAKAIIDFAKTKGREIETIRLYVGDTTRVIELFKPYGNTYAVKRVRAPLTSIDMVASTEGTWWGWVGRKKVSGAVKDPGTRGIRVRARNIQIDGIDIMKELFSSSFDPNSSRLSYARFAEYYVGEIFVEPGAAIPNARRDGFEEEGHWIELRKELAKEVGAKYGVLAYRVMAAESTSASVLTTRLTTLEENARKLVEEKANDWDLISPVLNEAKEIQKRVEKGASLAEGEDSEQFYKIATRIGAVRHDVNRLNVQKARTQDCSAEVERATSDLTQRILKALKDGLGPTEWAKARAIVREETGDDLD